MPKFTKGPWSYGTGNKCHDVYSNDGTKVCEVFNNLSDRFLIAAAPEMYEIIEEFMSYGNIFRAKMYEEPPYLKAQELFKKIEED